MALGTSRTWLLTSIFLPAGMPMTGIESLSGVSASGTLSRSRSSSPSRPHGRSGLGKQADSKKVTAPAHSFSHLSDRQTASRTFLSTEHNAIEMRCRESPGAIYDLQSSLDRQISKTSAPKFTFSKTERLKVHGRCGVKITKDYTLWAVG